jgi:dihydrolipoamide dehydrogenase
MRAHDLGKRVVLIERKLPGGGGLWGALSSKTLWHLSNDYARAKRSDRGYRVEGTDLHYPDIQKEVSDAVFERADLFGRQLRGLAADPQRFVHLEGEGAFVDAHTVSVSDEATVRNITADFFLIATGSRPRVPDMIKVDGIRVVTSDHMEKLQDFPKSLLIVGAGVVGCEYATIFGNFGKTKVRLLDRQPRILPMEDADVSDVVLENMHGLGIEVHHASKLLSLARTAEGVQYEITDAAGKTEVHSVEYALIATGRSPNTERLGLDKAGVKVDANGAIPVVGAQSSVPHIYASGDVTADVALVNIAEIEGRHAVEAMFGLNPAPIHYEALSAIMFLKPEVASVGLNERMAKEKGIAYRAGVVSNKLVARNVAMRATEGFIKLLAEKAPPHRILGLRVVGPQAASTAQGVAFLIDRGATLADIDRCIHAHPAVPEGVQECARLLLGCSLHKPEVFGPDLLRIVEGN